MIFVLTVLTGIASQARNLPGSPRDPWTTFPFSPGFGESWFYVLIKGLFVLVILFAVAWLIRALFGPGGPMRPKEFDEPASDEPASDEPKDMRTSGSDGDDPPKSSGRDA